MPENRYSTQSRAYRVFNKRTRIIVETIHVNFDELPQMALDHVSSDPVPQFVSKSSVVTTADASDKCQQQPDSTSSTSTLATTVTANGNFDVSYALSWKPCQGDSLNLPDHKYSIYTIKQFQGDASNDDLIDSLTITMMLLAKAITQHYSTPTNNHLHSSLNTRNQVYVHDGRVNVQSKNAGNAGKNTRRIAENSRNPAYG
ncbi:hypothetical protein Tco_0398000 [Tanacetum coccineum]